MSQPKWKLIANIGDASPFEHGGQFIFKDLTGKYPPELEIIEPMPDHITVDSKPCANVCRIVMEDLTKDTLCNEFWGDPEEIGAVAGFIGLDPDIFISYILGSDLVNRGVAWRCP